MAKDFTNYRDDSTGEIDLCRAYLDWYDGANCWDEGWNYLSQITMLHPVISRQSAAVAIALAAHLAGVRLGG